GGVKQKVLAAHRAGLRQVILPARNTDDLEDIPENLAADLVFHGVDTVEDVLRIALEPTTS
ncbi:MAG TPA: S16 family serine protease, partial [Acidimicrobiia bacterium]